MFLVHFHPADCSVSAAPGIRLSDAAHDAGLTIRTDCGASGVCEKCTVILHLADGSMAERLACQTFVDSDLVVTIPETSFAKQDVVVQLGATVQRPTETTSGCGAAFDIGTTTLAMELVDNGHVAAAVGRVNPQRVFGDDIISRIQKVIEDPAALRTMSEAIRAAANEMLGELAAAANIQTTNIDELSVAGNTVMEYLFHEIDPSPLGFVPFTPSVCVFPDRRADELGLAMNPRGTVRTLPILGGFVGGDLTAGVLAMNIPAENEPVLLIDIGTNGELVLWTGRGGELLVAATAAGPAFEGARIKHGTIAVPGAIERVEIDNFCNVSVRTIGNRPAVGICGSGLIDAVSELLYRQLMKPNGRFDTSIPSQHWTTANGKPAFMLAPAPHPNPLPKGEGTICLTQRDVQQVQLASGAIRAGTRLLLQHAEIRFDDIQTIYVAGGFGNYIDPKHARRLGLLPPEVPLEWIKFCGNTSLAGARRFLIERQSLNCPVRHLELASFPEFAAVFAESMIFPSLESGKEIF